MSSEETPFGLAATDLINASKEGSNLTQLVLIDAFNEYIFDATVAPKQARQSPEI